MAKYYIVTEETGFVGITKTAFYANYKDDYEMLEDMNSKEKNRLVIFYSKIAR